MYVSYFIVVVIDFFKWCNIKKLLGKFRKFSVISSDSTELLSWITWPTRSTLIGQTVCDRFPQVQFFICLYVEAWNVLNLEFWCECNSLRRLYVFQTEFDWNLKVCLFCLNTDIYAPFNKENLNQSIDSFQTSVVLIPEFLTSIKWLDEYQFDSLFDTWGKHRHNMCNGGIQFQISSITGLLYCVLRS